jgi:hypothetical protein
MLGGNSELMGDGHALITPYYVDQPRLLDIFAVLHGGYSEYEEITSSAAMQSAEKRGKQVSAEVGFHIFKISGDGSGSSESGSSESMTVSQHRVQTVSSMLSLTVDELISRQYIFPIDVAPVGSFVEIPVILKINSIKDIINEAKELTELNKDIQSLGSNNSSSTAKRAASSSLKAIEKVADVTRELANTEEVVFENNKYAVFGSISNKYLYQAERADIIGTDLRCLAEVKNIFPEGTQLLKNTVFTKLNSPAEKQNIIKAIEQLKNGTYNYDSDVIAEILDKPVYELRLVALFQTAKKYVSKKANE